ncbi:hypothetical protein D0868_08473 [Hortaea werneckii]|uniref:DUF7871 domain-containing protein n=1 Tax=Hortaea werneckii TaxID=91943 RepID=A0A3M6YF10_HORWE|nr:hypothetical protein D0868_08473 [Hortaea werneckii]
MASTTAAVPVSCCGREGGCACAKEATCSCGKQPALHCNCEKAQAENKTAGARCSCQQRPAGSCTCSRSSTENTKPTGATCACGQRASGTFLFLSLEPFQQLGTNEIPPDSCTCGGTQVGQASELETDFTTKASGA